MEKTGNLAFCFIQAESFRLSLALFGQTSTAAELPRNLAKEESGMKASTVAGMMAGGALGIAIGAGIMMMPQS